MKKLALTLILVLAVMSGSAMHVSAAGLTLTIRDGKVTLDAQDVTLRQILAEWARVGKTQFVNAERVTTSELMTIKLDGVPEDQALDIVLRAVPGYVAAPRTTPIRDASTFDRILIMATTTRVAEPPRSQNPGFQPFGAGVTQLRAFPTAMVPGAVPPIGDPQQFPDPALAAAAAAGLIPVPAPTPNTSTATSFAPGALQAPVRVGQQDQPAQPASTSAPANPWNAPVGTSRPGLAAPPAPSTTAPPSRPNGARPPQADQ